jgi:hypothetical protein
VWCASYRVAPAERGLPVFFATLAIAKKSDQSNPSTGTVYHHLKKPLGSMRMFFPKRLFGLDFLTKPLRKTSPESTLTAAKTRFADLGV